MAEGELGTMLIGLADRRRVGVEMTEASLKELPVILGDKGGCGEVGMLKVREADDCLCTIGLTVAFVCVEREEGA